MSSLRTTRRLAELPLYVPGRRPEGGQARRLARLASNEMPWPPQKAIVEAMKQALTDVHHYPDMQYTELRAAIAGHLGESPERVAVANGSTALLRDLIGALVDTDSEVIFSESSFPYYRTAAIANSAVPIAVPLQAHSHDLSAITDAITQRTRVIVMCNPNNPTGTAYPNDELEPFLNGVPDNIAVILDEAYMEFASHVDGVKLMTDHPNVIVARTLSKAYGLAGLRIGYAIGDATVMNAVSRLGVPFRIDAVAVAGALEALKPPQIAEAEHRVALIVEERKALTEALTSRGWNVVESAANFVFLPLGDASAAVTRECAESGVLVRPIGGGVRVTVGSPDDTEQFLNALPVLADDHADRDAAGLAIS